jgi:hypothetical protein
MQDEKRVSVRFPLDVLEAFRQHAKEDNRSLNSEVVWVLREYLKQRERETATDGVQGKQLGSHGSQLL